MAQIMETFDDIREGIGDKAFMVLIGGAVAFGLYQLTKGSGSGGEMKTVSVVTSYPDAVTNANVIIDSLQNSIDYSEAQIREDIAGLGNDINVKFEATNDYINKGIESTVQLTDKVSGLGEQLSGQLSVIGNKVDTVGNKVDTVGNISAMTYYELMLERYGHGSGNHDKIQKTLENAGFETSNEKGTTKSGELSNTPGSKGGGWTTFIGSNIKK